jgi:hypothetical protein
MATKLFNQVTSAVLADLQENNRECSNLEELIFNFLSDVVENSLVVNTAEEWDYFELHDMQQGEVR